MKRRHPFSLRTESYSTELYDPDLLITPPYFTLVKGISPTGSGWFSLGVGCYSTYKGIRIHPKVLPDLLLKKINIVLVFKSYINCCISFFFFFLLFINQIVQFCFKPLAAKKIIYSSVNIDSIAVI